MRQKSISYTITVSWGKNPEKQNSSNGSRSNCGRANRTKGYDRVQYSCSTIVGGQCWVRRKLEKELCISNIVRYQESWRKLTYPVCYKYQMSEDEVLLIESQELYQDLFGQIIKSRTVNYRLTIVGEQGWNCRKSLLFSVEERPMYG
jgi:hypothetical protein